MNEPRPDGQLRDELPSPVPVSAERAPCRVQIVVDREEQCAGLRRAELRRAFAPNVGTASCFSVVVLAVSSP